ncbi:MAG: polymerase sigma factor, sigma-70 family [Chlorobi bacterium]|nr:polymerase sigma factor, sigma-70 family [Chlorobiota bacterium]
MDFVTGSTAIVEYREGPQPEPRQAATPYSSGERRRMCALCDQELVSGSVAGNSMAFDELVVRYRSKVLRLIASTLGPDAEAEDIAQDIFVKMYLSLARFRGDASFSTYLYTVTVNRCRDELRKGKLRKFFSFDEWFSRNEVSHPTQDNAQDIDSDERRRAVRRAMKSLPTQSQMLLHLREIEELSYKDLADIFDVEIGTIKSRLARARERLRCQLQPYLTEGTFPGAGDPE